MARSTAQSECRELSTGTKISVYRKALPPASFMEVEKDWTAFHARCRRTRRMIWGPGRNVSRDQLASFRVPHGDRVDGARVTRAEQLVPGRLLRIPECGQPLLVESEGPRRLPDTLGESDAERAVDAHPQPLDDSLFELRAHIPSSPSSARARSMISGVSSAMSRSSA